MGKMLVDLELKVIADKHGHLCPELAIGWRVGLVARKILGQWGEITAGCLSCAVDALRHMGQWRLNVDALQGRHIYWLIKDRECVAVLEVPIGYIWLGKEFKELEKRVSRSEADPEDIFTYKNQIDAQIQLILSVPDQELFTSYNTSSFTIDSLSPIKKNLAS